MGSLYEALDAPVACDATPAEWLAAIGGAGEEGTQYAQELGSVWAMGPWVAQPTTAPEFRDALYAALVTFVICVSMAARRARLIFARIVSGEAPTAEEKESLDRLYELFRTRTVRGTMKMKLSQKFVEDRDEAASKTSWLEGLQGFPVGEPGEDVWYPWDGEEFEEDRLFHTGFWLLLVSRPVVFMWTALTEAQRLLYVRTCLQLAGKEGEDRVMAMFEQLPGFRNLALKEAAYQERQDDGGEKCLPRLLRRTQYLAQLGCVVLSATCHAQETARKLPLTIDREEPQVLFVPLKVQEIASLLTPLIDRIAQEDWTLTVPGTVAPSSVSDKSDGLRFLSAQARDGNSVYKMPQYQASQRDWEYWFRIVANLEHQYKGLSAQLIVANVTSDIKVDDRRWAGWQDLVEQGMEKGQSYTLTEFLSYIRRQVIHVQTTRRGAMQALLALCADCSKMNDLVGLSTRLSQLFAQLYPANSTEVEPMPRRQALNAVHVLLSNLGRAKAQSAVVRAWREYTSYDNSRMFAEFIDDAHHQSASVSAVKATEYLASVAAQLGQAHRQYVQTSGRAGPVHAPGTSKNGQRQTDQVMAIDSHQRAGSGSGKRPREGSDGAGPSRNNRGGRHGAPQGGRAPFAGGRGNAQPPPGFGRGNGRGMGQGAGRNGGGRGNGRGGGRSDGGRGAGVPAAVIEFNNMLIRALEAMRNLPGVPAPGALAARIPDGRANSWAEVCDSIRQNGCAICQQRHPFNRCLLLNSTDEQTRQLASTFLAGLNCQLEQQRQASA